jgi:hypothetical protein
MAQHQWFDRTQPQTLQNAVMLCYLDAALSLLFGLVGAGGAGLLLLLTLALAPAGYGIANEKRWGYWMGVGASGALLLLSLLVLVVAASFGAILNLLFVAVLHRAWVSMPASGVSVE